MGARRLRISFSQGVEKVAMRPWAEKQLREDFLRWEREKRERELLTQQAVQWKMANTPPEYGAVSPFPDFTNQRSAYDAFREQQAAFDRARREAELQAQMNWDPRQYGSFDPEYYSNATLTQRALVDMAKVLQGGPTPKPQPEKKPEPIKDRFAGLIWDDEK